MTWVILAIYWVLVKIKVSILWIELLGHGRPYLVWDEHITKIRILWGLYWCLVISIVILRWMW